MGGNLGRPGAAPGRYPLGFRPPLGPVVPPAPIVFVAELAAWLEGKLGIAVRPYRLPRNALTWPLLTFAVVTKLTPMNLNGPCGASCLTVQFDAWSNDQYEAELTQAKLFSALAGYRGPMGVAVCIGANPGRSFGDFTPNSATNDDQGIYRAMREWAIWHVDPAPIR